MNINKLTELSITSGIFLIGASLFYYLVIFTPKKEQMRADQLESQRESQKELLESQRELLETCIKDAQRNYLANWNKICDFRGKKNECALSDSDLERADNSLKESKNECFRKYPTGAVEGVSQEREPPNVPMLYQPSNESWQNAQDDLNSSLRKQERLSEEQLSRLEEMQDEQKRQWGEVERRARDKKYQEWSDCIRAGLASNSGVLGCR